jgi:hypothetical protein
MMILLARLVFSSSIVVYIYIYRIYIDMIHTYTCVCIYIYTSIYIVVVVDPSRVQRNKGPRTPCCRNLWLTSTGTAWGAPV